MIIIIISIILEVGPIFSNVQFFCILTFLRNFRLHPNFSNVPFFAGCYLMTLFLGCHLIETDFIFLHLMDKVNMVLMIS